jgi:PAS domain S-box-containing protein
MQLHGDSPTPSATAELYQRLFNGVHDVVYTLDRGGNITSLNPAFARVTGWTCTEWIGKPFAPLIHPEDVPLAFDTFNRALTGDSPTAFELRVLTKHGDYRVGEFLETPETQDGEITGVLGIARDVTDLRRMNTVLQDSERQYRLLFEKNPHPMWVLCADSHSFLDVNEAAIREYGYAREEFLSMKIEDIRLTEDPPAVQAHRIQSEATPEECVDAGLLRHMKKDGTAIEVELTRQCLDFKGKPSVLVLAVDITDRRLIERALRDSEARFRSIAESASDAIIVADGTGDIVQFNKAAEKIFGYEAGEVLNGPLAMLMPQRYRDGHMRGMEGVRSTRHTRLVGQLLELHGLRKDGSEFPIELSLAVWRTEKDLMFCSGIIRDMTNRKEAEKKLQEAREELESRVRERTAELAQANEHLHEKINELETFHDVVVGRELHMMSLEKELESARHEIAALKASALK